MGDAGVRAGDALLAAADAPRNNADLRDKKEEKKKILLFDLFPSYAGCS